MLTTEYISLKTLITYKQKNRIDNYVCRDVNLKLSRAYVYKSKTRHFHYNNSRLCKQITVYVCIYNIYISFDMLNFTRLTATRFSANYVASVCFGVGSEATRRDWDVPMGFHATNLHLPMVVLSRLVVPRRTRIHTRVLGFARILKSSLTACSLEIRFVVSFYLIRTELYTAYSI